MTPERPCIVPNCDNPRRGREACRSHENRKRKYGTYADTAITTSEERFWLRVRRGGLNDCWLWLGMKNAYGYGWTSIDGQAAGAHVHAYRLLVGPVPDGLTLDHLCRVRACCNPRHLDPVPQSENVRRVFLLQDACKRGHPFDEENTYVNPRHGRRSCRACHREQELARWRAAHPRG